MDISRYPAPFLVHVVIECPYMKWYLKVSLSLDLEYCMQYIADSHEKNVPGYIYAHKFSVTLHTVSFLFKFSGVEKTCQIIYVKMGDKKIKISVHSQVLGGKFKLF